MARGGLSATRATEIIDFLTSRGTTAFTLSELAKELDINVASCHAILQALIKSGHLSRHPKHKTYTLGPALVAIGHVALKNHELIARAQAAAEAFCRNEQVEVLLTMRAGETVLGLAHFQSGGVAQSLLRTGQRLPLQVPFGATFVAWEPDEEIDRWIHRGLRKKVEPQLDEELRTLLGLIRQRGYQISLKDNGRPSPAAAIASWEPSRYLREAAHRMRSVHDHFQLLFFDPLKAAKEETFAVEFITVPLFDHHNKSLYAMTLYNFDRKMKAEEIHGYLSRLLSICESLARDYY